MKRAIQPCRLAALSIASLCPGFIAHAQSPSADQSGAVTSDQPADDSIPPAVAKELQALKQRIEQLEAELKNSKVQSQAANAKSDAPAPATDQATAAAITPSSSAAETCSRIGCTDLHNCNRRWSSVCETYSARRAASGARISPRLCRQDGWIQLHCSQLGRCCSRCRQSEFRHPERIHNRIRTGGDQSRWKMARNSRQAHFARPEGVRSIRILRALNKSEI